MSFIHIFNAASHVFINMETDLKIIVEDKAVTVVTAVSTSRYNISTQVRSYIIEKLAVMSEISFTAGEEHA